jgi:hypothetical protein
MLNSLAAYTAHYCRCREGYVDPNTSKCNFFKPLKLEDQIIKILGLWDVGSITPENALAKIRKAVER